MRYVAFGLLTAFLLLTLVNCGTASKGSGPLSISSLPKVTQYVTTASSAMALPRVPFFPVSLNSAELARAATSGTKLSQMSSLTWNSTHSRAMCFTGDVVRNILSEAAGPDLALCKLGVLEKHGLLTVTYDGSAQYFSVSGLDGTGTTSYYKFDATKGSNVISEFHMYSCKDTSTQDSYLTATISGDTSSAPLSPTGTSSVTGDFFVSMRSISHYTSGSTTGKQFATTSGFIDTAGNWVSKGIAYQGISTATNWNRSASISIDQTPSKVTVYGSFTGRASSVDEAGCFWSAAQRLNMDSLTTAAIGDGYMKSKLSIGSPTCPQSQSTEAWYGDNRTGLADASTSDFYADSTNIMAMIPTQATVTDFNVAFTYGTDWNCTATGIFTPIDLSTASSTVTTELSECDQKYTLSRTGANCQNAGR